MRAVIRLFGRASWNVVDQALSALTNAVLGVMVAREVSKTEFGAFGVAFVIFMLLIGVSRALVGQVLGIRYSHLDREAMRDVAGRGFGTVLTLGVPTGVLLMAAGLVIRGQVGPPLIAVGLVMAPLLLQDTARMVFFAESRAHLAAMNDALWAVVQFTAIGVLIVTGHANAWTLILAWGGAAGVCVLLAMVQLKTLPRPSATREWVRSHGNLLAYLLPETLLTTGGLQASVLLVGRIVGVVGVGSLRAAQVLLGPLVIVSTAVMTFSVPEISRRENMSPQLKWRAGIGLSLLMTLTCLGYLAILLLLPDGVGHFLFRDSWAGARSVLVPIGLFTAAANMSLGPALIIIATGHAQRTLRLTIVQAPLLLTLMPLGAVMGGAPGAAWGQFAAEALVVPVWFWQLRQIVDKPPIGEDVDHLAV